MTPRRNTIPVVITALLLLGACQDALTLIRPEERTSSATASTKPRSRESAVASAAVSAQSHDALRALRRAEGATPIGGIEVLDEQGNVRRVLVVGSLPYQRATVSLTPEVLAQLRASVARLRAMKAKGMPSLELTVGVLDALSASSAEERHRLIALLPVKVSRVSMGSDASGRPLTLTTVTVRGVERLRVRNVGAVEGGGSTPSTDQSNSLESQEVAVDVLRAVRHGGPSAVEPTSGGLLDNCETDPNDPCATQEEKDDILIEAVALQSDLDATSASFEQNQSSCYVDNSCFSDGSEEVGAEHTENSHGPMLRSVSVDNRSCEDGGAAQGRLQDCTAVYLAAASGIAWGASGVAGVIAIAASPEPVSKLGIFAAWSNAVAGVTAAAAGVVAAYQCHYAQ